MGKAQASRWQMTTAANGRIRISLRVSQAGRKFELAASPAPALWQPLGRAGAWERPGWQLELGGCSGVCLGFPVPAATAAAAAGAAPLTNLPLLLLPPPPPPPFLSFFLSFFHPSFHPFLLSVLRRLSRRACPSIWASLCAASLRQTHPGCACSTRMTQLPPSAGWWRLPSGPPRRPPSAGECMHTPRAPPTTVRT